MRYFITIIVFFFQTISLSAQSDSSKLRLNGQIVGWTTAQIENPLVLQPGGRFVPALTGKWKLKENSFIDIEASLNINGNTRISDLKYESASGEFKPYRVWARYAGNQFEIRGGLQKINFGQAKMFRPLMWFDGMDVRDPLQLTDGVYGILGKYFFENNANIWGWVLAGNEKRKGWEIFPTQKWKPEVGGRFELPIFKGEMAVTTHFRRVDAYNLLSSQLPGITVLKENRIGLDGKWDLGAGLWFEASTTITEANDIFVPRFQDMWNVGMDYTFPLGNGLGITLEYLRYHSANKFFTGGNVMQLVGSMFSYPLSINDNVSFLLFYVPGQNSLFNYASWNRAYDNWSIYVIGFWNPANAAMLSIQTNNKNIFSGKGMQIMLSYNF